MLAANPQWGSQETSFQDRCPAEVVSVLDVCGLSLEGSMVGRISTFFLYLIIFIFWVVGIGYLIDGFYFFGLVCWSFMVFSFLREKFNFKRGWMVYWATLVAMLVALNFIAEYTEGLR